MVRRADQVLKERARPLWVRGEVSGWKQYPSGHCYFTLKDDQAELCCTLWAAAARALPALPENGMVVDAFGQIGIYPKKGQFQLEVTRLEASAAGGMWRIAMERLVGQLRAEGLLDEARKRPIPAFPERVGIVTSSQSAGLHDMLRALRRKAWWMTTHVSHCPVEGADAAPEIAAAIRRFGTTPERCLVDVVIVARGGGSMESLWAYNTEAVARAIAACPVPVISAVGHETDHTVADLVADVRAATPTAGAERAVPDGQQVRGFLDETGRATRLRVERAAAGGATRLQGAVREIDRSMDRRVALLDTGLAGASRHLEARSPRQLLGRVERELRDVSEALHTTLDRRLRASVQRRGEGEAALHDAARRRLRALEGAVASAAEHHRARTPAGELDRARREVERVERELAGTLEQRVAERETALGALADALDARSPMRVLARGYATVTDPRTGRVVRSPEGIAPGDELDVQLAEGRLRVRAEAPLPPDRSSPSP